MGLIINPYNYESVDLKQGLISVWEFNETSGTTAYDAVGNYNGINSNVTINQAGKIDKSYLWDSSNGKRITIGNHADFHFGNVTEDVPFSISAWINLTSNIAANDARPICGVYDGSQYEFIFGFQDNFIGTWLINQGNWSCWIGTRVNYEAYIGAWTHVTLVYDGSGTGSGCSIFINGELKESLLDINCGSYVAMATTTAKFTIGELESTAFPYNMYGYLEQVAVWRNKVLNFAEVHTLYNSNNGLAYTNW